MIYSKRIAIQVLAIFILLLALMALTGWWLGITALISITGKMTAMNPVTAFTAVLCATWLLIRNTQQQTTGWRATELTIAVITLLTGIIKLADYAHPMAWHIDDLLFAGKLSGRLLHNAIAPTTALLFAMAGILMLDTHKRSRFISILNDVLLLSGFLVAYIAIIGYVYSMDSYYQVGPFVPMALNTALCFMALFTAFFLLQPPGGLTTIFLARHTGGRLVRRAVPVVLLVPAIFGYGRLLLHRASFYNVEYSLALDTAFIALAVLLLIFFYSRILNKKDEQEQQAAQVLAESEDQYKTLVNSLKEGIISFAKNGEILYCNPSFYEITGYTCDEIVGRNVVDTLATEENKETSRRRMEELVNGEQRRYESVIKHKDGSKIIVYITHTPVMKDGVAERYLSTFFDITERKKREEDIEAFSASAAHDLNAPLTRIETLARFIQEDNWAQMDEDGQEHLRLIMTTASEMRALLKDLLVFSRVGMDKVNRSVIDTNKMVQDILDAIPHPSTKVVVEGLPVTFGDPGAIKQVWINLISNAIKYSSKKEHAEIHIGVDSINNRPVYYVKDNGAGFDMKDSGKLFAPFKRLHSDFEGNGLGLPIVKRIVEKHGGKIWAESEKGKGAAFYFTV